MDFSEFYEGRTFDDIDGRDARFWKGDIFGSVSLANEFRAVVHYKCYDQSAYKNYSSAWRNLFRFLAENTDLPQPVSISQIDDVYGKRVKRWLNERGVGRIIYKRIKAVVDAHFQKVHGRNSLMPPSDPPDEPDVTEVDLRGLQMLNLELRRLGRSVKENLKEGRELAKLGRSRWGDSARPMWSEREYHAYCLYELTKTSLPSREEILHAGGGGLTYNSGPKALDIQGPNNILPLQGEHANAGIVGKLRWFFLGKSDTAVFLWIVLILTGFNYDSVLNIDITDETSWWLPALQSETRGQLIAFKERSGGQVFAPSDTKAEFHAYQIIKFMVAVTAPLRETLRIQRDKLVGATTVPLSYETIAEISRLDAMIKSPWLYISLGEAGRVLCFEGQDSSWLNSFIREVAELGELDDVHPYLKSVTTRQPRKSLLEYTNETSGSFMAAFAAGHSGLRELRYYLSRRKRKERSFKVVRTVVGKVIEDIEAKRPIDAAKIRIFLARGQVTPEQAERLNDLRQRTRLGMGCLQPQNPPKNVAPDHKPGTYCRVQRCTGCCHGVVFPESVKGLAYSLADLHYIKKHTPALSWTGSSFEAETRSIIQTLEQFDREIVDLHYRERKEKILAGTEVVLDGYASF